LDFVTSTLFILERRNTVIWSNVESSLLNILLNLVLIPLYQEMGALTATGVSMVYMVLRQLYVIQRQVDVMPVLPVLGKCLLFSLVAVVPAQATTLLVWDNIFIGALVYLLGFAMLLAVLKPFTREQSEVLKGIHRDLPAWMNGFTRV